MLSVEGFIQIIDVVGITGVCSEQSVERVVEVSLDDDGGGFALTIIVRVVVVAVAAVFFLNPCFESCVAKLLCKTLRLRKV